MLRKPLLVVAFAAALLAVSVHPAGASGGGTSTTSTSLLKTISVVATASDSSSCSEVVIAFVQHWQCTPVLIAAATPQEPVSTGGSVTWRAFGTCEYRKRADGAISNDWGPWAWCGTPTQTVYQTRSWGALQSPQGGLTQLTWPTIINAETVGTTDCVEIRTTIVSDATAKSLVETTSAYARYPASGTNLSGICEGSNAY